MIGTLEKLLQDMEHGVYDFTKDGKCSQCGACCSNMLWLSEKEISRIKRYIKKHNIKEQKHVVPAVLVEQPEFDLTCPFLNMNKKNEKCVIYDARPAICRFFICNDPNGTKNHPELYEEEHVLVSMRETFFGG